MSEDKKFTIALPSHAYDAQGFVKWLNDQGHDAEIQTESTGTYIDGTLTYMDAEANRTMNGLWTDYCNDDTYHFQRSEAALPLLDRGYQTLKPEEQVEFLETILCEVTSSTLIMSALSDLLENSDCYYWLPRQGAPQSAFTALREKANTCSLTEGEAKEFMGYTSGRGENHVYYILQKAVEALG